MLRNRLSPMDNSRFKSFFSCGKWGYLHSSFEDVEEMWKLREFSTYLSRLGYPFIHNSDSGSSFNLGAYSFDRLAELVVRAHRTIDFTNRVDDGGVISVPEQPANVSKRIVQ